MKTLALLAALFVAVPSFAQDHQGGHHRHGDRQQVAPQPPPAPAAMGEGDFAALEQAVNAEAFCDRKVATVQAAAAWSNFSVDQVGRLVDLMTFNDDKLKVVELTNPKILDRANSYQLFGHFIFDDDKEAAGRILGI